MSAIEVPTRVSPAGRPGQQAANGPASGSRAGRTSIPPVLRALQTGATLTETLGFAPPLTLEACRDALRREAGVEGLWTPELTEPLSQLLASLREEAGLNAFGRFAAWHDVVRLLRIRCRMALEERRDPTILAAPTPSPIIITGMPRSGSTFLHGLLAKDGANRVAPCWEAMAPFPPRHGPDRRQARATAQLRGFHRLAPSLASLHPLIAETPQECSELMAASFASLRFDTTYDVPAYKRWLDACGHGLAYRFLKRMLQHLQRRRRAGGWVLKCPDHVFALDALLQVFPDARLVVMHRDPLKVLASAARLTEVLREPFVHHLDRRALGRKVADDWLQGVTQMATLPGRMTSDRLVEVHYLDLVTRPMHVVRTIYDRFGLTPAAGAWDQIRRASELPGGGYGRNVHDLSAFGLSAAAERARFGAYLELAGVQVEDHRRPSRPG
jgi:hypothetical protein